MTCTVAPWPLRRRCAKPESISTAIMKSPRSMPSRNSSRRDGILFDFEIAAALKMGDEFPALLRVVQIQHGHRTRALFPWSRHSQIPPFESVGGPHSSHRVWGLRRVWMNSFREHLANAREGLQESHCSLFWNERVASATNTAAMIASAGDLPRIAAQPPCLSGKRCARIAT